MAQKAPGPPLRPTQQLTHYGRPIEGFMIYPMGGMINTMLLDFSHLCARPHIDRIALSFSYSVILIAGDNPHMTSSLSSFPYPGYLCRHQTYLFPNDHLELDPLLPTFVTEVCVWDSSANATGLDMLIMDVRAKVTYEQFLEALFISSHMYIMTKRMLTSSTLIVTSIMSIQ